MLPSRIIMDMCMMSRYCWPVKFDWAILILFFIKRCQKNQSCNYNTSKSINLSFITPASPFSPGRLVITCWPWPSRVYGKCGSEFCHCLIFQGFPETLHATNCSSKLSCKGFFCAWGPCNTVVRLLRTTGYWIARSRVKLRTMAEFAILVVW